MTDDSMADGPDGVARRRPSSRPRQARGIGNTGFADANAAGEIGPVLDEMKPDAERVRAAVVNGIGVMPAFEALTAEQVDAVARYVSEVAGRAR